MYLCGVYFLSDVQKRSGKQYFKKLFGLTTLFIKKSDTMNE